MDGNLIVHRFYQRGIRLALIVVLAGLAMFPQRLYAQGDTPPVVITPHNAALVREIGVLRGHAPGDVNHLVGARMTPDGETVVSASTDDTIRVWTVSDGTQRAVIQTVAHSLALSPDGQQVAYGTGGGQVVIIDIASGDTVLTLGDEVPYMAVSCVVYSADGTRLVYTGPENSLVVWDVAAGSSQTLSGHEDQIRDIALSPDGTHLVSVSWDKTVRLWDLETGQAQIVATDMLYNDAVAYSPDGTVFAVAGFDGMRWYDAATGAITVQFPHTQGTPEHLAFSPDGRLLAAAVDFPDHAIMLWDVETQQLLQTLEGHAGYIHDISFAPDGTAIISSGEDDVVHLWGVPVVEPTLAATGGISGFSMVMRETHTTVIGKSGMDDLEIVATLPGEGERFGTVAFSPDGTRVAAGGYHQPVLVYLIDSETVLFRLEDDDNEVLDLAFSPDGQYLATASRDDTVKLWSMVTGQLVRTFYGANEDMRQVAFSPDGSRLYGVQLSTVTTWETETGATLAAQRLSDENISLIGAFAISPDGMYAALGVGALALDELQIWDLATNTTITSYPFDEQIWSVTYAPDGTQLVVGLESGATVVLDAATGETLRSLIGHSGMVMDIDYSLDLSVILSAGVDQVIVWDADNGAPIAGISGVDATAFSPDGTLIATLSIESDGNGGIRGVVYLWGLPE